MTCTKYLTIVFKLVCFVLVAISIFTLLARWTENHDRSSIGFKQYHDRDTDRYPTFSLCFQSLGNGGLYTYFETELISRYFMHPADYETLLKGDIVGKKSLNNYMDFQNISNINYENYTIALEDVVEKMKFETVDANHSYFLDNSEEKQIIEGSNLEWPFYIGHRSPDMVCFTRKSEYIRNVIRKNDWINLKLNKIREWNYFLHFKIYIHHPGQLTRVLEKPIFDSLLDVITKENNRVVVSISQVSVLRKRPNANFPCDPELQDDELKLKQEIIKRAGCTPSYWKTIIPSKYLTIECSTSSQLASVYHDIETFKKVLNTYKPPCSDMKIVASLQRQTYYYDAYMYLEFLYMDENYQEIVNQRDFTMSSFWSNTGGFVGMILGYSLLQVPDVIGKVWDYCLARKHSGADINVLN